MNQRTMSELHYGIQTPHDLLEKLLIDGSKITEVPNKYDLFNFVLTAAVLSEWITKFYKEALPPDLFNAMKGDNDNGLPAESEDWIKDKTCIPNASQGISRHICNAMRICHGTANASKHYYWQKSSGINSIQTEPEIKDWYDYYFTASGEGIFINYKNENYTIGQVKDILVQFYPKLIEHLNALQK